jgi:hypothetical protein
METKDFIKDAREQVKEIKDIFDYPNLGSAFVHWCIDQKFGGEMPDDDIREYCEIGGKNDKGIDSFWPADDEKLIYIVQGKYAERGTKKINRGIVTDLRVTVNWLENPRGRVKQEVRDAASIYRERVEKGFNIKMILIVLGKLRPGAQEEVDQFNQSHSPDHEIEVWDLSDLQETYENNLSREEPAGPDVELNLIPGEYFHKEFPEHPSVVATVRGEEIAKLRRDHRLAIFHRNIRYYLGGDVAQSIKTTAQNPEENKNFWYYNNGISVVCDDFSLDEDNHRVQVRNFQIVNGVQTATALYESLPNIDDGVTLLTRITKAPEEARERPSFSDKIAFNNNSQNPVKTRDLMANHPIQIQLQNGFDNLGKPVFYERKRKEWEALPKAKQRRYKEGRKRRLIRNHIAGKAYLAFRKLKPKEAKATTKNIFVSTERDGFYDEIFTDSTTVHDLLLPMCLLEKIEGKIKEFTKEYKEAEENNFRGISQEDQERLKRRLFLKHANYILLAMMGYLMRKKYDDDFSSREILEKLETNNFDEKFDQLYDVVMTSLDGKIFGKTKADPDFSPRNYFLRTSAMDELQHELEIQLERAEKVEGRELLEFLPT